LTEEIALNFLANHHNYDINNALRETLVDPAKFKKLLQEMNSHEERTETIAFIDLLTSDYSDCFF
jgi:hypothetical protein